MKRKIIKKMTAIMLSAVVLLPFFGGCANTAGPQDEEPSFPAAVEQTRPQGTGTSSPATAEPTAAKRAEIKLLSHSAETRSATVIATKTVTAVTTPEGLDVTWSLAWDSSTSLSNVSAYLNIKPTAETNVIELELLQRFEGTAILTAALMDYPEKIATKQVKAKSAGGTGGGGGGSLYDLYCGHGDYYAGICFSCNASDPYLPSMILPETPKEELTDEYYDDNCTCLDNDCPCTYCPHEYTVIFDETEKADDDSPGSFVVEETGESCPDIVNGLECSHRHCRCGNVCYCEGCDCDQLLEDEYFEFRSYCFDENGEFMEGADLSNRPKIAFVFYAQTVAEGFDLSSDFIFVGVDTENWWTNEGGSDVSNPSLTDVNVYDISFSLYPKKINLYYPSYFQVDTWFYLSELTFELWKDGAKVEKFEAEGGAPVTNWEYSRTDTDWWCEYVQGTVSTSGSFWRENYQIVVRVKANMTSRPFNSIFVEEDGYLAQSFPYETVQIKTIYILKITPRNEVVFYIELNEGYRFAAASMVYYGNDIDANGKPQTAYQFIRDLSGHEGSAVLCAFPLLSPNYSEEDDLGHYDDDGNWIWAIGGWYLIINVVNFGW